MHICTKITPINVYLSPEIQDIVLIILIIPIILIFKHSLFLSLTSVYAYYLQMSLKLFIFCPQMQ